MKLFKVLVLGAAATTCQGNKLRGQKAQNKKGDRKLSWRFWVPSDATSNGGYTEGIATTSKPTNSPTKDAKVEPDPTAAPVWKGDAWKADGYPTLSPSLNPTIARIEQEPTKSPVWKGDAWKADGYPTLSPTLSPEAVPIAPEPTKSPVWKGDSWGGDSHAPSSSPVAPIKTLNPTLSPTLNPTFSPTWSPTLAPITAIVPEPTTSPAWKGDAWKGDGYPTLSPSLNPTIARIEPEPTKSPAWKGDAWKSDVYPTLSPTNAPTELPFTETDKPTRSPVKAYEPVPAPGGGYVPSGGVPTGDATGDDEYSGWLDWDDDQFNRKKLVV